MGFFLYDSLENLFGLVHFVHLPSSPFVESIDRPPFDDVDPQYGLHGYQLHIVLHNTMDTLMSERFTQLSCHRSNLFIYILIQYLHFSI